MKGADVISSHTLSNVGRLAAATGILLLCCVVYWPGLQGPFLLDDYGSLGALGDNGGISSWATFKAYVFGGFTGPSGRPLALLSFLIDGTNWPTDPWPFKRTNLVIHLLNGLLLGIVCASILRLAGVQETRLRWVALLSAGCWLLHPFLVSTTLYPVQRMAQLATTFVLGGLAFYIRGRLMIERRPLAGYLVMSVAVGGFTILATLSKENGILLPLLLLVLEGTVFAGQQATVPADRRWTLLFLVIPTLVVAGYMLKLGLGLKFFETNPPRDFSTYERLLTESRILLDYLRQWMVPSLYTPGIFQDHFQYSRGFFAPVSTTLSLLFHVALIVICLVYRRRYALFAFSVLFFYAAHLLESTFLNLELYFEHRNYLPAAFLFLPVFAALDKHADRSVFALAGIVFAGILAGFTANTARTWSDYDALVETAARVAPMSARAQQQYSMILFNEQKRREAIQVVNSALERMPDKQNLLLWRSSMLCELGTLESTVFDDMAERLSRQPYDLRVLGTYQTLFAQVTDGKCPQIGAADLQRLFERMLQHPGNAEPELPTYSQLQYFLGAAYVQLDKLPAAMQSFNQSMESRPGAGRAMAMAALLATHGHFEEALRLSGAALEFKRREREGTLRASDVNQQDILDFQAQLRNQADPSP